MAHWVSAKPITLLAKDGANIYSTGYSITGVGPLKCLSSEKPSGVRLEVLFYADPPLYFFGFFYEIA